MKHQNEIHAAKKCYKQLIGELDQDQVDWVLNLFGNEAEAAKAFEVHRTTVSSWTRGGNKPNGRNKLAFNLLLNLYKE